MKYKFFSIMIILLTIPIAQASSIEKNKETPYVWENIFISQSGIVHYSKTIMYSSKTCFNKTEIKIPKKENITLWGLSAIGENGTFESNDFENHKTLSYYFQNPVCNKSINITYNYFLIPGVIKGNNITITEINIIKQDYDKNTKIKELNAKIDSDYELNKSLFWIKPYDNNCTKYFEEGNAYIICENVSNVEIRTLFLNKEFQNHYFYSNKSLDDILAEELNQKRKTKIRQTLEPFKYPLFFIFLIVFLFGASRKNKNIF